MSCKHPLSGAILGTDPYTGKKVIKILPIPYNEQNTVIDGVEIVPIPCGHCIDCRLSKSKEWAMRCMFELETSSNKDNCFFLTLTYNDDNLPMNEYMNEYINKPFELRDQEFSNPWLQIIHDANVDEGSILDVDRSTLPYVNPIKYEHVQEFIKKLRSHFDYKYKVDKDAPVHSCRYFGCAEYSPRLRPHYHLIMFDVPLDDLKVIKVDKKSGYIYFVSDTISSKWTYGFHIITQVCYETCAYVSQYILKKQYGKNAEIYKALHIPPERTFMSRRPGIGRDYYDQHKYDIYMNDNVLVKKGEKSFFSKPPKYYDKLFDADESDIMEFIKEQRLSDINLSLNQKKELTDLSYRDILDSEERIQIAKTKILKERSGLDESLECKR